ncbi:hypothetical protein PANI_CDS0101 [Maribacter phage Panino]
MGRIRSTLKYPRAELEDILGSYVIGTVSGSGDTKNYFFLDMYDAFRIQDGKIIITEYDIDTISSLYDYHGGVDAAGDWIVIRYLKTDLTKTVGREVTNGSFNNLQDAWNSRETLLYL